MLITIEYQNRRIEKHWGTRDATYALSKLHEMLTPKVMRITAFNGDACWTWDRKQIEWNTRVEAVHAAMRDQIMALRPTWDRAKLDQVRCTWGQRGLREILTTLHEAAHLDALFKTEEPKRPPCTKCGVDGHTASDHAWMKAADLTARGFAV